MVKYESDATKGLKMEKPAQNITVYNYFYGNSQFSLTSDIWKAIQYIVYVFRVRLKRQILFSIIYNCSCHSNTTKKFCIPALHHIEGDSLLCKGVTLVAHFMELNAYIKTQ